ncbi:MAG: hypothetical protein IPK15_04030 [Verrucomicrobia bacterium]|nr:hypothetical protein [Verrucomicrobiota bacterium]
MKSLLSTFVLSATLLVACTAAADPKSEVSAAIKKLEQQSGYSWSFTPKVTGSESAGRGQVPLKGKADKDGYAVVSGEMGDITVEIGIKGEKMIVNYTGEWLSTAEIGENNRTVQRLRLIKRPTDEATMLAGKATGLKKEADGAYASELDGAWAKEMFALFGRRAAAAPSAQGAVKFWLKDGSLAKYEFVVKGKITTGEDKTEVEVSRTAMVEIKDVGAATVSLPDEAKKKLQ